MPRDDEVVVDEHYRTGYLITLTHEPGRFTYAIWHQLDHYFNAKAFAYTDTLWGAKYKIRRHMRQHKKLDRLNKKYSTTT